MSARVITGDCRIVLATLPSNSVHCVVTSPPYFGLRDYGVSDQIGLEPTVDEFVTEMVAVFQQVRRVLRDDGTCWLNLGDSYAGSWGAQGKRVVPAEISRNSVTNHPKMGRNTGSIRDAGLKPKDLMMIPARVALALQADGWWLRSAVIWHKPNPMPESTNDRPTSSYENVFLLTKAERYFYDAFAIQEGAVGENEHDLTGGRHMPPGQAPRIGTRASGNKARVLRSDCGGPPGHNGGQAGNVPYEPTGTRNRRNVWTIASQPYPGSHFATFPPRLAELCILAGTSERGCCACCGAPWVRVVEKGASDLDRQRACGGDTEGAYAGQSTKGHDAAGVQNASDVKRRILEGMRAKVTTGWVPTCECSGVPPVVPCTVLDPFGGAGTTGLVADRLQRDSVLIELNPEYAEMARRRIQGDASLLATVA